MLDAVVPLGLALAWYEGYTPVCTKRSARLLKKKKKRKKKKEEKN